MIIKVFSRLLLAAYFIEAGLLLTVTPWSSFWDRNYFAYVVPALGAIARVSAVRGAVTGVGLLTAVAGLVELAGIFAPQRAPDVNTGPGQPGQ